MRGDDSRAKAAKTRVLVVADDADRARTVTAALKKLQYHVTGVAANGEQATAKAAGNRPDLLFVTMTGAEAAAALEAAARIRAAQHIPVVVHGDPSDRDQAARTARVLPAAYRVASLGDELATVTSLALDRAAGERQLLERQHWHAALLDCIGDGVIATDCESRVVFMNPVAEGLTGWSRRKAAGRALSEVFHTIDEHNRKRVESSEIRALRDDTALDEETENVLLVSADGVERPVLTTVSPINDAQGNLLGVVVVFRDITAHREVQKRAIQQEKMEALGRLSGSIAHDFNNIIGLVAGYAAAMQEYLLPNTRAYDDIRRIVAAVEHAGALSKRILGVARASDNARSMEIRPLMLADAVQGAVALLREAFEQRRITIDNKVASPSPYINANRDHVVDLLVDILLNAAEAMEQGGTITIESRPYKLVKRDPKLNPRAQPGPYVCLRISDSGSGMTRDTLEHLFEPFFTTKSAETHVGLGLSVVHSAVQNYGGWIKVSSEPKEGTTFAFYLPETAPDARPAAGAAPARETGSILVVDDDPNARQELHEILKQAGYKVHVAAGGEEAIAMYPKLSDRLDLAIVDVIMPGKNGKDVLETIMKVNPTAAVIMVCGFSREYVRSFLPSGPWRFVQKPLDREAIVGAVRRIFEQKAP